MSDEAKSKTGNRGCDASRARRAKGSPSRHPPSRADASPAGDDTGTDRAFARRRVGYGVAVGTWPGPARARAAAKLNRLQELVDIIADAIRPGDLPKFLMTPHPELRGHSPADLLDNAFAFEAVKSLVLAAQSGTYR